MQYLKTKQLYNCRGALDDQQCTMGEYFVIEHRSHIHNRSSYLTTPLHCYKQTSTATSTISFMEPILMVTIFVAVNVVGCLVISYFMRVTERPNRCR